MSMSIKIGRGRGSGGGSGGGRGRGGLGRPGLRSVLVDEPGMMKLSDVDAVVPSYPKKFIYLPEYMDSLAKVVPYITSFYFLTIKSLI